MSGCRHLPLRSIPLATLAALAVLAAPSTAHDWPSPGSAVPRPLPQRDDQTAPDTRWPGWIWPGPAHGAPSAPSATHCARAPVTFDVPGPYSPHDPRRPRTTALAAPGAMTALGKAASPATAATAAAEASRADSADRAEAGALAMTPPIAPTIAPSRDGRPAPAPHQARPADEPVTAGVVDDNADFGEYQAFRARWAQVPRRDLAIDQRVLLDVRDGRGRPVPDALVEVFSASDRAGRHAGWDLPRRSVPLWARTDAGGRAWLLPQADAPGDRFEVRVSHGGASTTVQWRRGQRDMLQARLDGAEPTRARLDIVFAIDATGSMGDEIDKLKTSMRAVADQIARLPSRPDLCFGLVAYRDRGDEFFVRGADLSNDLGAFQSVLGRLRASGGGDYPEAMNEALHTAIHRISWRGEGTARIVILLADAPPHLDHGGPRYDDDARGALARGIKIFGVGASGLDRQGELVMRQLAQATGGRFVFLTYADRRDPASGPGRETTHDVRNYSVETLDKLLVRLVSEEMARWPEAAP